MAARIDLTPPKRGRVGMEARRRAANRGEDRAGEMARCASDPAHFTDNYCVIDDTQGGAESTRSAMPSFCGRHL